MIVFQIEIDSIACITRPIPRYAEMARVATQNEPLLLRLGCSQR